MTSSDSSQDTAVHEQRIDLLCARMDVQDLLEEYGWAIDEHDWDSWIQLFTEEGVFSVDGRDFVGRSAVLEVAQKTYERLAYMRRILGLPRITMRSLDSADARAYFQLIGATKRGKEVLAMGVYHFHLVREDRWRIVRCDARFDHYSAVQLPGGWGPKAAN